MHRKKLTVIGGGAAGFFCAVNAARMNPELEVVILEKTNKLLSKVRVSGGGRCNVTHDCTDIGQMSGQYPRGSNFVKKTFYEFFTTDTIKWFEERGVKLKTEKDGRMFPVSDSSETIVSCLLNESMAYGVEIKLKTEVKEILQQSCWCVKLATGETIHTDFICIASGGYQNKKMFGWLESTGHSIIDPVPSLFTFNLPSHPITRLMGVSVENVKTWIEGTKLLEHGPLLITHWGVSGPVILRLSAWGANVLADKNYEFNVHINWLGDQNELQLKELLRNYRRDHPTSKIQNMREVNLPSRLWKFLLKESEISEELRFSDLPLKNENKLIKNLCDYYLQVKGKTTFKEEFVTAGGISLREVDNHTMMSKKAEGLFFAGEILNVDGITGGYNFQHAWSSGWLAARGIINLCHKAL